MLDRDHAEAAFAAAFAACLSRGPPGQRDPASTTSATDRRMLVLAVVAGRLAPAGRGHPALLAQQRGEDLRLLHAVAGQRHEPRSSSAPSASRVQIASTSPSYSRRPPRTAPAPARPSTSGSGAARARRRERSRRGPRGRTSAISRASSRSRPSRWRASAGAQNACSIGICWSSSIPISSASGSRSSSASASGSWAMHTAGHAQQDGTGGWTGAPPSRPAAADALRTASPTPATPPTASARCSAAAAHAALGRGEPEPAVPRQPRRRASWACWCGCCCSAASSRTPRWPRPWPRSTRPTPRRPACCTPDGDGWRATRPAPLRRGGATAPAPRRRELVGAVRPGPPARQERDHVTGVGGASLTLAAATARRPVGVAARPGHRLRGAGAARRPARRRGDRAPTSRRARWRMARATFALNELRRRAAARGRGWSRWPDARFDQIVSNPPFVPGPARVDYVYRDSGQARRRRAGRAAVRPARAPATRAGSPSCWAPGCTCAARTGRTGVRSWLPDGRRRVDPAARGRPTRRCTSAPGSATPGWTRPSPAAREQAGGVAGLDGRASGSRRVGFGFLVLRRTDGRRRPSCSRTCPASSTTRSAPRSTGWLDRVDWLRAHAADDALLGARLRAGAVGGAGALRRAGRARAGRRSAPRCARMDGPRWRHEVDEPAAALLAGCRGALPLRELVELLAFAHDRPAGRAGRRHPARGPRAGPARPAAARRRWAA